jgi:hypothetical protein
VASQLAQYYLEKTQPVVGLDDDSVNASLSSKALNARHIHLRNGDLTNVDDLDQLDGTVRRQLRADALLEFLCGV